MAAKTKIGAGIALDGEKEFKSAISGINKDLSVLGSEMGKVTAEFGTNKSSIEALTAKSDVYNKQIDEQKKKITVMTEALENAKKEYGENSNKVKDWQISLNKAESELAKTENALRDTGDQAKKLNKVDLSGFSSGLGEAGEIAGKMAVALGAAAVAAAAGIAAMTTNAAYAADDINTLSKQTGMTTEDIQKFQYASEQIDVPMETIAKGLSKTTKAMGEASKAGSGFIQIADGITVATTDANGNMLSSNEVFYASIDALGKMTNETERDIASQELFGKSFQDLNPLIEGGSEALKKYGDDAQAAGLILGQDALDNLNSFADSIDTLKATATGAGGIFATAFAGPMADGINTITGYLQDLTKSFTEGGFSAMGDTLGAIISDMVSKAMEFLPKIMEIGLGVIQNVVGGIQANLPVLMEGATKILMMLVDSLISMLPQILEMGITMLVELANGIAQALPQLVPKIVEVITKIVTVIIENLPLILGAALQIIVSLAAGLLLAIPELIKAVPELIKSFVTAFKNNISTFKSIGSDIVKGVWQGIKDMAVWFKSQISDFFGGIVDAVKNKLGIHSPSTVFAGIGEYMAQGLGVGFENAMADVSKQINNSVPTDVSINGNYAIGEGIVNGLSTVMNNSSPAGGTYILQVAIDSKAVAQAIFDPLKAVATQRGVSLA